MGEILHSLYAFQTNAFNHLMYMLSQNWGIAIILIAAVLTSIMYLNDAIIMTTRDEQHII